MQKAGFWIVTQPVADRMARPSVLVIGVLFSQAAAEIINLLSDFWGAVYSDVRPIQFKCAWDCGLILLIGEISCLNSQAALASKARIVGDPQMSIRVFSTQSEPAVAQVFLKGGV